jgi:oxaloacetate decarboxylase alpha subunit
LSRIGVDPALDERGNVTIYAPVSGTVIRYMAAKGAAVAQGETVMIFESLNKEQLEIKSPAAGTMTFTVPA